MIPKFRSRDRDSGMTSAILRSTARVLITTLALGAGIILFLLSR
jgi:hypothetical protein